MKDKIILIKKETKIIPTSKQKYNLPINKEIHDKLKQLSLETRIPMTVIANELLTFAINKTEIRKEND